MRISDEILSGIYMSETEVQFITVNCGVKDIKAGLKIKSYDLKRDFEFA